VPGAGEATIDAMQDETVLTYVRAVADTATLVGATS